MKDLEVICVNDGSTDSSPAILDEYAESDSRIRVIHQENSHLGVARNNGLAMACGEYIHFLDSDDYLTDNAYEEPYRVAKKNRLDYLRAKAYAINALTGDIIKDGFTNLLDQIMMQPEDYITPFSLTCAPEKLTTLPVYAVWCNLYNREFLINNNIDFDSLHACEDHSFYYNVAIRAERIMVVDIYMVWYRRNNEESLSANSINFFTNHIKSYKIICDMCRHLDRDIYSTILSTEMKSLFFWYNKVIDQKDTGAKATQIMHDFIMSTDFSLLGDRMKTSSWYPDYLILKWETVNEDKTLTGQEYESLIEELKERVWDSIPLPLEKIKPGSKIVLYGAGKIGKLAQRILKMSNLYEIVQWVDNNWVDIQSIDMNVTSPSYIKDAEYDCILIAVVKPELVSEIRSWLIETGVSGYKIVSVDIGKDSIPLNIPVGRYERVGYELLSEYPDYRSKYDSYGSKSQISFILGLISEYRFLDGRQINTVLEIGVYNGVTSLYMLKEGCKRTDFKLYGIEICEGDFYGKAVLSEATSDELLKYSLHLKKTSYDIEDIISDTKIDMVFIDAAHTHPHPLIDLIHVIPFLHEDSLVLLHDVVNYMRPNAWGESFIYCGWDDEKLQTVNLDKNLNPADSTSLGVIRVSLEKKRLYDNIERIAKIPFRAAPWELCEKHIGYDKYHIDRLRSFMKKNYDEEFAEQICSHLKINLEEYEENWLLLLHETKFFNYLFERSKEQEQTIKEMQTKIDELSKEKP